MHEQVSIARHIGEGVEINYVSALNETLEWEAPALVLNGYHGVILGGSGDFDFDGNRATHDPARNMSVTFLKRLAPLLAYVLEHDVPTFGICYGHQLLGAHHGVSVRHDREQQKTCSHQVQISAEHSEHPLFFGVPDVFHAHYGHKDVLHQIPEGATLLASGGSRCQISALQYKNNIFSTQFHPELRFSDMYERAKSSPGYLPEGVSPEEVFHDDPHSNTLLRNFSRLIRQRIEAG